LTRALSLKLATPELIPQIYQIDRNHLGGFWTEAAYLKECLNPNSCLICLVDGGDNLLKQTVNQSENLIGFGCLWSILEEAHIIMLAVIPPHQRQGLGKSLVWGLLNWAKHKGLEWATLEVRASNLGAIALYRYFGFSQIGERKAYYDHPLEDAVIMWRKGLDRADFEQSLANWQVEIGDTLNQNNWSLHWSLLS
jgi:[ribosomal protein S18]-alanine N-acetyltransferase